MTITNALAIGTLASTFVVALPYQAASQNQQGSQPPTGTERQIPADQRGGSTGTAGQNDQGTLGADQTTQNQAELPGTASPLALIALGGVAALGAAAAIRRKRG